MKDIRIWYLYNSGYAIKIDKKLLIFDYYKDTPIEGGTGLDGGVIRKADLEGLQTYVFVSHRHHDHYNKVIYDWKAQNPSLRISYILSDDVEEIGVDDYLSCAPNQDYHLHDLKIKTLKSNDEGISFYVQVDGLNIFHSGDLNWWRWEGEPDEWNDAIESSYKRELEHLKGLPLDFAFIPIDPRLEKNYSLSLKYFTKNIMPPHCILFPMHFGDSLDIFSQLKEDDLLLDNLKVIHQRGQRFDFKK